MIATAVPATSSRTAAAAPTMSTSRRRRAPWRRRRRWVVTQRAEVGRPPPVPRVDRRLLGPRVRRVVSTTAGTPACWRHACARAPPPSGRPGWSAGRRRSRGAPAGSGSCWTARHARMIRRARTSRYALMARGKIRNTRAPPRARPGSPTVRARPGTTRCRRRTPSRGARRNGPPGSPDRTTKAPTSAATTAPPTGRPRGDEDAQADARADQEDLHAAEDRAEGAVSHDP